MKFRDFLNENKNSTIVAAFGRFNIPTIGHGLLAKKVVDTAKSAKADHIVYASRTQDAKKNPLDVDTKVEYLKKMFPGINFKAANEDVRTFIEMAAKLSAEGYKNLVMIAGSDRIEEYQKLLNKYNGKDFKFNSIKVVSAGERDPDADGAAGMSGTKMREAAIKGNFKAFRSGIPKTLTDKETKELMDKVRKIMIKEETELDVLFEEILYEGVHDKGIFKAVFLAGGPGSGKDYVLDNTLAGHGMTEINSDKAFEYLLDKEKLDKRMPDNEEEQRNAVRDKAKSMTELRQRLALQGRNGLVINGTGDDYDKIKRIKEKLEALGYETSMMMVNTADEVSKTRNVERGQRGGRTVPEDKRKEKWDAAQKARPKLAELFKDNYVEFDNSEDLRSAHPDVVKGKKNEMTTHFKNFQKFISKPPKNDIAKEWVASQLGNKDTLPTKSVAPETMHPSNKDSKATEQARQLGLTYFGFGRWGKGGVITHHVVHGSLVANAIEKRAQTVVQIPQTKTIEKIKKVNEEFESFLNEESKVDLHPSKLMKDNNGKVRTFMIRRNAAKEAHTHNGVVHKAEKGYVVKIKENEDVKSNSQFSKNENEIGRISESGSSTRTNTGTSGENGRSFYEETGSRKKITLTEIRSRQKEINEIDAGIEPGLSMASSGENFSRGLDRSMVTTGVKYNRDPKKKTIKELTGDETTMSTGDKKEDELKKVGINLSSFKAKKFVG
jgi:hypothetical protein